jgi:hypothetical protein
VLAANDFGDIEIEHLTFGSAAIVTAVKA